MREAAKAESEWNHSAYRGVVSCGWNRDLREPAPEDRLDGSLAAFPACTFAASCSRSPHAVCGPYCGGVFLGYFDASRPTMRLSIGARLVGGFIVVVALIGVIGFVSLGRLREASTVYDNAMEEYARVAVVALQLEVAVLDQVRAQKNYLLRGETAYLEQGQASGRRVREARARLMSQKLPAEEQAILRNVDDGLSDLEVAFQSSIAVRRADGVDVADRMLRGKAAAIVESLDRLVAQAERQAESQRGIAVQRMKRTRQITLVLIAAVGLIAIGLGVALSLSVTLPLKRLQAQITAVAGGGSTPSEPAIKGRDEVAQIAQAFHETVQTASLLREMETRSKRLAALSARVARAQEEERERIARELHDGLGQALTAIRLDLSAAGRRLGGDEGGATEYLGKAQRLTEESLDELRRIVFDLRPPALDHLGLVAALESYAREFEQRFKLQVTLTADEFTSRLPFEVETALYRICQEALTNVSKHANASQVLLRLERDSETVALTVQDDGAGFDAASVLDGSGALRSIGILSMERRAEELGGEFRIESSPGRGTRIRAAMPLKPRRAS